MLKSRLGALQTQGKALTENTISAIKRWQQASMQVSTSREEPNEPPPFLHRGRNILALMAKVGLSFCSDTNESL